MSPFYDVIMFCVVCGSMDHRWLKICPRPRSAMIYGHWSILSWGWNKKTRHFPDDIFKSIFLNDFFSFDSNIYLYIYICLSPGLNWIDFIHWRCMGDLPIAVLLFLSWRDRSHYSDAILRAMASQIIGVSIVCSTVCSGAHQKKASKLLVTGICEGNSPVSGEFPHKSPVTRKMFPFDDVIIVSAPYFKLRHPYVNTMGIQSSYELQWLDIMILLQDGSSSDSPQGAIPKAPRLLRNLKTVFSVMGTVLSLSWDRLIYIIGIPILGRRHLYIETHTIPHGLS